MSERPEMVGFDWMKPNYLPVFNARIARLAHIRAHPEILPALRMHYKHNPWDFIADWGMTYAPKANDGGPAVRPFLLFDAQIDWLKWVVDLWQTQRRGLTEKSRESGVTWLAVSLGCTLCLFHNDLTIGYGANLVSLVDTLGDLDSILEKGRFFLDHLPVEFTGGWSSRNKAHSKESLLKFPETNSTMKGQGGDNIGRGGRASIVFVDEFAHIQRAKMVDQALSATTDTQIDISTVRGLTNEFAIKRHSGRVSVKTLSWRQDPRKDQEWYDKQVAQFDPVLVAQEIDIDYSASVEGVLIPSAWAQAAVGAAKRLGLAPTGRRRGALDVADEGVDKNCFATARGIEVDGCDDWSGKGADIFDTVATAFVMADDCGLDGFTYDADGLGAGVRGDARVLNESREGRKLTVTPFRGSGAVWKPDAPIPTAVPATVGKRLERTNKDYFANAKAQACWMLRLRFQRTFRAIQAGTVGDYDPDDLVSIDPDLPGLPSLLQELSQPTYAYNTIGKMSIDKAPVVDGKKMPSPNKFDAVMQLFAPRQGGGYDMGAAL